MHVRQMAISHTFRSQRWLNLCKEELLKLAQRARHLINPGIICKASITILVKDEENKISSAIEKNSL